mmetsp:Transcript_22516/g.42319  ORF Transcript_22516/g.42319 Transcript_22516/m.42319 type:complete len:83 (+) Transcript_22516:102-350(+)
MASTPSLYMSRPLAKLPRYERVTNFSRSPAVERSSQTILAFMMRSNREPNRVVVREKSETVPTTFADEFQKLSVGATSRPAG